jgi:hypothetical protein
MIRYYLGSRLRQHPALRITGHWLLRHQVEAVPAWRARLAGLGPHWACHTCGRAWAR